MPKPLKITFIVSYIFLILGSFLPWSRVGDLISYLTYGIRIFPSITDNGGFIVLILSIIDFVLIYKPVKSIKHPLSWGILICSALVFISIFHIIEIYTNPYAPKGIGAPNIEIGLIMVMVGSIILLICHIHRITLDIPPTAR
jgi:hypothetical protein